LGGSITKAYNFFETSISQSMADFLFPETVKRQKIIRSKTANIELSGAAALVNNVELYNFAVTNQLARQSASWFFYARPCAK
jgi:hypothetical protein